jgi:type I pantothenate kinase
LPWAFLTWSTDAVGDTASRRIDRYRHFRRSEWAQLRSSTQLEMTEQEVERLISFNDALSLEEAYDVYLPLTRLLHLYVHAVQELHRATDAFLARPSRRVPFVIGIAGSVAVGKSTTARLLELLLARFPQHPRVDLVTTDGFLFPTAELTARGLMGRKGFPESYDGRRLLSFLADVKSGCPVVKAPVYSHLAYDIVRNQHQVVRQPDILIVEGLNVLQGPDERSIETHRPVVSDFFDFSVYVDSDESNIERWYIERFLAFRKTVFADERSYFHRYSKIPMEEALDTARGIWASINAVNLRQNILPTRERAHLILEKGRDHSVTGVHLRKL